jgi:hypothetical protein
MKLIEEIVVEAYWWNIGRLDYETGENRYQDSVPLGLEGGL